MNNNYGAIIPPKARQLRADFVVIGIILLLAVSSLPLHGDVSVPKVFGSHMVLQRDMPVQVWGWAEDGERVTVSIQGQSVSTVAEGGKWSVKLQPLKAGGPFTLTITGNNSVELSDVLVGDVWVSCGQSNMMMGLAAIEGGPEQVARSGGFPQLRLFNAEGEVSATVKARDLARGTWGTGNPATVGGFSAISYLFGRRLNEHLKIPVGMINVVAIMPAEAWVDRQTLDADPMLAAAAKSSLGGGRTYNGLVAPLQPFGIKGVIYYQGEYNAGRAHEYRRLLPSLIQSWRHTWGLGEFPFFIVQLPGFSEHKAERDKRMDMPAAVLEAMHQPGTASAWAELREAQMITAQKVTNTGLAVTIDLGDPQDIHPKYKAPIAERLVLAARALAYGERLVHSGPVLETTHFENGKILLRFVEVGGGLIAKGGRLRGFELGRNDGTYVFANAEIRGNTIAVSNPEVPNPVAVRYAWADFPQCNLYNAEGLPASPFRTYLAERAQAADEFTVTFKNPGFEQAGGAGLDATANWVTKKGAGRTNSRASEGTWSMRIPVGGEVSQDGIVPSAITRYDWNSDPLERVSFRPGYAFGYSIDIAAGPGMTAPAKAYLRLCGRSTAEAYQYWGGVPEITTPAASGVFVTRQVAGTLASKFDLDGGGTGVGILLAYLPGQGHQGEIWLDHLSPITIVRPRLTVSDISPIDLGTVTPNTEAVSSPRTIANGQVRTLADHRNDRVQQPSAVATVLYGSANLRAAGQAGYEHVWGPTDDVGAVLVGPGAAAFEFASVHRGASPRELKLLGPDGQSGLQGGPEPETEKVVVRFVGAAKAGTYSATLRIVTQAANLGRRSIGQAGEPLEAFYYLDLPITVRVRQ